MHSLCGSTAVHSRSPHDWQVREETGFDITSRLVPEDCIEMHIKEQRTKLFIITNVSPCESYTPFSKHATSMHTQWAIARTHPR